MTEQYAKTLGAIAFAEGKGCIPAMDANFVAELNHEIGSNIAVMKAWQRGWMEANLACSASA